MNLIKLHIFYNENMSIVWMEIEFVNTIQYDYNIN